jgi:hypothetical protein
LVTADRPSQTRPKGRARPLWSPWTSSALSVRLRDGEIEVTEIRDIKMESAEDQQ